MRIVIYDDELEPLTVIEFPHWWRFGMPDGQPLNVPMPPLPFVPSPVAGPIPHYVFRSVRIRFEKMWRNGREHWLAIADDADSALLLRAAFLPGQNAAVQERERQAFSKGFIKALDQIMRL